MMNNYMVLGRSYVARAALAEATWERDVPADVTTERHGTDAGTDRFGKLWSGFQRLVLGSKA